MTAIVPPKRPEIEQAFVLQLLAEHGIEKVERAELLGRRGYYRDTMGEAGKNDRGIYDDCIVLVSPTAFLAFNANCDPSAFRVGIANLKAGLWLYKIGTHNLSKPKDRQYKALVQAGPVTVVRDKAGEETGYFGINHHRGGYNTTSSLGCQTIYPTQWDAYLASVTMEMKRYEQKVIRYVLTERAAA